MRLTEKAASEGQSRGFQCPQCRNHFEASKVIKWSVFQKVHMKEAEEQAEDVVLLGEEPVQGSADSDSSDNEEKYVVHDVDSKGEFEGFHCRLRL